MRLIVFLHLHAHMLDLRMSADITKAVVFIRLEHFRFTYLHRVTNQPSSAKTQPFVPQGCTKTGHTSITITLIKKETKAQHLHSTREVTGGLNQI